MMAYLAQWRMYIEKEQVVDVVTGELAEVSLVPTIFGFI